MDELARLYNVSTVTIRHDLNDLDRRGLLVRSRGGALANSSLTRELSVTDRYKEHRALKQQIGRVAASLVNNEESLLLDSGTTTEEIARCLKNHSRLRVMTNALNVATVLSKMEQVELTMDGGALRAKSQSFYDGFSEYLLENMHFDKFFLGVHSFSLQGVSTHHEPEARLNRARCQSASQVIAVTDSSKFGNSGMHLITDIANLTAVITDSMIPQEYVDALESAGVALHLIDV